MRTCFLVPPGPSVFVQLGRYGDIMIMLPALWAMREQLGQRQILMVAREFADVLDGVSYVEPWVVDLDWLKGVVEAQELASSVSDVVVFPKWWDDPRKHLQPPPPNLPSITLSYKGRTIPVPVGQWESYQLSMWETCGFSKEKFYEWPLIFDQRDRQREEALSKTFLTAARSRPIVLYNFGGITNPFKAAWELHPMLRSVSNRCHLVDLSSLRAVRIYDLLGLFERARGLITSDTATLHLAHAMPSMPYIGLIGDGGAGSLVKANCVLPLRYSEVAAKKHLILSKIQEWIR